MSAARGLPSGKSPGPDCVPNEVIRVVASRYPGPFVEVFNRCLDDAVYPSAWKVANLALIPKAGRPIGSPSAFRPICMLDTVGKLCEKILSARLRAHLDGTGALAGNQYGFRRGKSTLDALEHVLETVRRANGRGHAKNRWVGMMALDVKKAFNCAPWFKIIEALRGTEVPSKLVNLIGDYLSDRNIQI